MPEKFNLALFVPEEAFDTVARLMAAYPFRLEIKSLRSTLGKFQLGKEGETHCIRMRKGLSKHLFLLVLLHEIAHLYTYEQFGRSAKPHGREWKHIFGSFLKEVLPLNAFPPKVADGLVDFIRNPKASMINSRGFYACFEEFSDYVVLDKLSDYECFAINNNKYYQKLGVAKKHIRCRDLQSGKAILARSSAPVKQVSMHELPLALRKHLEAPSLKFRF
jgi:hypothetical protein